MQLTQEEFSRLNVDIMAAAIVHCSCGAIHVEAPNVCATVKCTCGAPVKIGECD